MKNTPYIECPKCHEQYDKEGVNAEFQCVCGEWLKELVCDPDETRGEE